MNSEKLTFTPEVKKQFAKLGVAAVYFFGSRVVGTATPLSDFDFGVLLKNPLKVQKSTLKLYEKIYKNMTTLVHPESLINDVLDIVFLDSPRVPLELKFHIIRHGKIVFDANPSFRANFEADIMLKSADFAPLRIEMSKALMARL